MSLVRRRAPLLPDGPLFAQVDAKALEDIWRHARPRRYAAGDVICREGTRADSVLVLQRGSADVHVTSGAEKGTAIVGHLRAGDIVGEVGALTGLPRTATVVASSDASALEITRKDFDGLLADHPRLQTNLMRILGARLASSNSALRGTSHDVVALVVGTEHPGLADRVLEAARRATPRPAAVIDLRGASDAIVRASLAGASAVRGQAHSVAGVPQALERLDRLETDEETAILVVRGEERGLARLLARAHRVVAVASRGEALALTPRMPAGHRLADLVLLGTVGDAPIPALAEYRIARRCADVPTASDIAWLGRHVSRTKLGLALGAGGAKSFAHAGVIDALQRARYVVDYVAGSSMGAVTAVWLALGMSGVEIADALSRRWASGPVVDEIFRKGAAGDGVRVLGQLLRETTGDRSFADLPVPATVMTADLAGRCPAPLTSGALWDALMAALAIPGLIPRGCGGSSASWTRSRSHRCRSRARSRPAPMSPSPSTYSAASAARAGRLRPPGPGPPVPPRRPAPATPETPSSRCSSWPRSMPAPARRRGPTCPLRRSSARQPGATCSSGRCSSRPEPRLRRCSSPAWPRSPGHVGCPRDRDPARA